MARVLIVDDTAMIRSTIRIYLEDTEHEVIAEADDGIVALAMCRMHQPDAILMDISMPGIDGIEASRIILSEFPDTHIIINSFLSDSTQVRRAGYVGVQAFLSKPVSRARLLHELSIVDAAKRSLNKAIPNTSAHVSSDSESSSASEDPPEVPNHVHGGSLLPAGMGSQIDDDEPTPVES